MPTFSNEVCLYHSGCPHFYCATGVGIEAQAAYSPHLKNDGNCISSLTTIQLLFVVKPIVAQEEIHMTALVSGH